MKEKLFALVMALTLVFVLAGCTVKAPTTSASPKVTVTTTPVPSATTSPKVTVTVTPAPTVTTSPKVTTSVSPTK